MTERVLSAVGATSVSARRSLYARQRRARMPEMQDLFDGPAALVHCSQRRVSTVPLQPLFLLNSQFMVDHAEEFANRIYATAGSDLQWQVESAFQAALGRLPQTEELHRSVQFLKNPAPSKPDKKKRMSSLTQFCHALLNLNEFLYIE